MAYSLLKFERITKDGEWEPATYQDLTEDCRAVRHLGLVDAYVRIMLNGRTVKVGAYVYRLAQSMLAEPKGAS